MNTAIVRSPLRLVVAQRGYRPGKVYKGRGATHKGAYTAIAPVTFGFVAWSADTTAEPWRDGFGSFLLSDIHKTRAAIAGLLADARTMQIQVRDNQDRCLFVVNRTADGSSTIYDAR
jgi:hypothetical protein